LWGDVPKNSRIEPLNCNSPRGEAAGQRVPPVHALEHGGDGVAGGAGRTGGVGTGQLAEIGTQACALLAVGQRRFFVVDERQQFVAGDAVGFGGPIAPVARRLNGFPPNFKKT